MVGGQAFFDLLRLGQVRPLGTRGKTSFGECGTLEKVDRGHLSQAKIGSSRRAGGGDGLMFQFAHPEAFWLFILPPLLWLIRHWRKGKSPTLRFSDVARAAGVRKSWRQKFSFMPEFFRLLVFS